MRKTIAVALSMAGYAAGFTAAHAMTLGKLEVHVNTPDLYVASLPLLGNVPANLSVQVVRPAGLHAMWWAGSQQTIALVDRDGAPRGPISLRVGWDGHEKVVELPADTREPAPTRIKPSVKKAAATLGLSTEKIPTPKLLLHKAVAKQIPASSRTATKPQNASVVRAQHPEESVVRTAQTIYVRAGMTAWVIAETLQKQEAWNAYTIEGIIQQMVEQNPQAFAQGNPNELLAGSQIRVSAPGIVVANVVTHSKMEHSGKVAVHRLRMCGVGEQHRVAPKHDTTVISSPVISKKSHADAGLGPSKWLADEWAILGKVQVPEKHWGVFTIARLVNGTSTLSEYQVAAAIFRKNRSVFVNGNPFKLKGGVTLIMPNLEDVERLSEKQARLWWIEQREKFPE